MSSPTTDKVSSLLASLGLGGAAVAWWVLAWRELAHLQELRELSLLPDEAPRHVLLLLLPLAAAWGLVLWWSAGSPDRRLLGATLAQALSVGAFIAALPLLTPLVTGPIAGGTAPATVEFALLSLGPQLLAFVLGFRVMRKLRPRATAQGKTILGLALGGVLGSLVLNALVGTGGPHACPLPEGRARTALQTLISGQSAYQSMNDGRFGTLECLVDPQDCLPDYPATGPVFLDESFLTPFRCGYRFTFQAVRDHDSSADTRSLEAFAATAVPIDLERPAGRSFCAESTGVIRFAPPGTPMPAPSEGRCDEGLETLQ